MLRNNSEPSQVLLNLPVLKLRLRRMGKKATSRAEILALTTRRLARPSWLNARSKWTAARLRITQMRKPMNVKRTQMLKEKMMGIIMLTRWMTMPNVHRVFER